MELDCSRALERAPGFLRQSPLKAYHDQAKPKDQPSRGFWHGKKRTQASECLDDLRSGVEYNLIAKRATRVKQARINRH
jgi:hypothetical protein